MAYTFKFRSGRGSRGMEIGASSGAVQNRYRVPWMCEVGTDANDQLRLMEAQGVIAALNTGLFTEPAAAAWPNDGCYYTYDATNEVDYKVDPWALCNSQICRRDETNLSLWHGETTYAGIPFRGVSAQEMQPVDIQADVGGYGSLMEWELNSDQEEVLYEDLDTPPKKCRLPTDTYYTEPFIERINAYTYRFTQLEDGVTQDVLADRLWRVSNEASWYLDPGGGKAGQYLIDQINAKKVQVPISGNTEHRTYLTSYRVQHNPIRTWQDRRALFDYYYNKAANDPSSRTLFVDDSGRTLVESMIEKDGTKRDPAQTTPAYETYNVYKEISFSFIRQPINTIP